MRWAVENGYPEIVSLLIEAGADVDVEDASGRTAVVLAEESGKTEIALLFRACRVGQELNPGESCDVSACPSCPSWSTSYSPFGRCPP